MEHTQISIPSFSVDPDEYPFTSHWFEQSGARLHYVDEGAGPAILLLHGNPTWSYLYRHVIKALRGEARCPSLGDERPGLRQAFISDSLAGNLPPGRGESDRGCLALSAGRPA